MGLSKPKNITVAGGGGMEMELLWENASPSSAFAAQTVSIDLTEYEMVGLIFNWVKYDTSANWSGELPIQWFRKIGNNGSYVDFRNHVGAYFAREINKINDAGIEFGRAFYNNNSSTPNNDVGIPFRIYGVKGATSA